MYTVCPNQNCSARYKIRPEFVGKRARCSKCQQLFLVERYRPPLKLEITEEPEDQEATEQGHESGIPRKRRLSSEVIQEHLDRIKAETSKVLPDLDKALATSANESQTRLLINRFLENVLGYEMGDLHTEQSIDSRRADYVVSIDGTPTIVIEAKKAGMALRDRQLTQATIYGATSGIRWAILTNASVWMLYRVYHDERLRMDPVFTIDLRDGLDDEEALYLYMISKPGLSRKKPLLHKHWKKMSALCFQNIAQVLTEDEVVGKVRKLLNARLDCKLTNDDVREAISSSILQLT